MSYIHHGESVNFHDLPFMSGNYGVKAQTRSTHMHALIGRGPRIINIIRAVRIESTVLTPAQLSTETSQHQHLKSLVEDNEKLIGLQTGRFFFG